MSCNSPSPERGATLLSVLLIVMLMSVAVLGATEALGRAVQVNKVSTARSDTFWSVRGVAKAGEVMVREAMAATGGEFTAGSAILTEPIIIPLEHGILTARFEDASNCFNLNTLLEGGRPGDVDHAQANVYQHLLMSAGLLEGDARRLTDSLSDWLDEDSRARVSGAEDASYRIADIPHRAGNTMLENVSELLAINGYTRDIVHRLIPLICVRKPDERTALNINTLRSDQAALLSSMFSEELSRSDAERIIAQRPEYGWQSVAEFLAIDEVARIAEQRRNVSVLSISSPLLSASLSFQTETEKLNFTALYARTDAPTPELISINRSETF